MPDGFIHIVAGDLELLSARAETLEDDLRGLDVDGALARVGAAMPGSLSSGAAAAATAVLRDLTDALGSRYTAIGSGTADLAAAHRSNDEAMADLTPRAASGSALQWAIEKGLA
ncbi:hypothetical protein SAMN05216355_10434 [Actinomyces ruminicola]|uniref:Excreted virulence factor EspC, type VII ESX diderm n=1 Tax=Actinomyces ruminicola TaxID=332524 RepID=A0A1H0BGC7_9ACTO|nr:hypothetical protein [Actinomyces ruminicola]SDN44702.1 hypothetical protein SAMN05216355_10434 [Actinomyces ruminicola]